MTPRVSVVVAAHNRPEGIAGTLAALRAQTLAAEDFEIVVVDDGSAPDVGQVLEREAKQPGAPVRLLRNETPRGPAAARNVGWRAARGELVAFTDDDCAPTPRWLESGLRAWGDDPKRFVQGPTLPDPEATEPLGLLSHTLAVPELGPWWETANIFYPRAALERVGGFDDEAFERAGEDTDLGWRVIAAGYEPAWAPGAVVHHAVTRLSAAGKLRLAWRWDETMLVFKRHRPLRRHLTAGLFWQRNHWYLVRAAVALALPKRFWWARWWLAAPYVLRLGTPRPDVVGFLIVHDLVEVAACARGAIRYRVPVL